MPDTIGRVRVKSLLSDTSEAGLWNQPWLRNEKYWKIINSEKIQGFATQTLRTGVTTYSGTHNFQLSFHSGPFIILWALVGFFRALLEGIVSEDFEFTFIKKVTECIQASKMYMNTWN